MKLTDLEIKILLRVAEGKCPWNGNRMWHTRIISQTLQRLLRKGAIIRPETDYVITFVEFEDGAPGGFFRSTELYVTRGKNFRTRA
jgi:hypothetical protein